MALVIGKSGEKLLTVTDLSVVDDLRADCVVVDGNRAWAGKLHAVLARGGGWAEVEPYEVDLPKVTESRVLPLPDDVERMF